MHDLAARLLNEMASARAAIAASYLRLWQGLDLDSRSASGKSEREQIEPTDDARPGERDR